MRQSLVLALAKHVSSKPLSASSSSTICRTGSRIIGTSTTRIGRNPRSISTEYTPSRRYTSSSTTTADTSISKESVRNASSTSTLQPPSELTEPLPRSINPSTALLLLTIPQPPSSWPAKLEFASPLLGYASRALKTKGVIVNAVWDGSSSTPEFTLDGEEIYPARIYWPDGTSHSWEKFSKGVIISGEVDQILGSRETHMRKALSPDDAGVKVAGGKWEVLVCTHGSRDCRCGETGGEVVRALKMEIEAKALQERVSIREVAHVGGHKYAANAILVPSLDMISNLRPEHVPALISWIIEGRDKGSDMWQHWRGRYGLTEIEQAGVWGGVGWAHKEEKLFEDAGLRESQGKEVEDQKVAMRFKTFEGEIRDVQAGLGETLLTVGKRETLPAIEGVCGGKLECATCHVYVPASAPVPEASEAELDMLGYALGYRDGESRLGCQIKVTRELAEWAKGQEDGIISLPRY